MLKLLQGWNKRKAPVTGEDELAGTEAPLLEHLVELRQRLIYSVAAFAALFIFCFFFAASLFDFLLQPLYWAAGNREDVRLIYTAPQEFFFTQISVAMYVALFMSCPVIIGQIYAFVAPGLYKNERGAFIPYLVATPILFLIGAALMYYGVLPLALGFFLSMQTEDVEMLPRVSEYLGLIMTLVLAFGICFQLPVVLTLLARLELVTTQNLRSWRKYAIVAILVIAAFLTPPDPISQIGLAIPMLLLYELSIFSVRWVEKNRGTAPVTEQHTS